MQQKKRTRAGRKTRQKRELNELYRLITISKGKEKHKCIQELKRLKEKFAVENNNKKIIVNTSNDINN